MSMYIADKTAKNDVVSSAPSSKCLVYKLGFLRLFFVVYTQTCNYGFGIVGESSAIGRGFCIHLSGILYQCTKCHSKQC